MPDEEEGNRKVPPGDAADAVPSEEPIDLSDLEVEIEAPAERPSEPQAEPEPEPAAAEEAPPEGGEAPAESADRLRRELREAEARAEQATRTAATHLDRLRRLQAEFENYRKRVRRDQEEERKRANERLIADLLPVLDSFERALTDPGDRESLLDGLRLIQKQLTHTLTLQGLERVESVGAPFDPARHEALAREPTAEHPEETVIREFEPGYTLHGRVLRPARVVVAAAPPAGAGNEAPGERKAHEPEATKPTRESGTHDESKHVDE